MSKRAGRVLGRGRMRVDARRALAKLREHQLVDLHHYTLELARAAVASGAASIDVGCDADDVIVSWRGEPLATALLPRLLDHVLGEAVDRDSQRLRLLAVGINAALGLEPAFVDLYAVDAEGARCVRFAPAMLKAEGDEDAAEPRARQLESAMGLGLGSVRVHLRRRLSWSVLRRAATAGVPREVVGLGVATEALDTPLTLNGRPWSRPESAPILATVPLELGLSAAPGFGAARRAELQLMAVGWPGPTLWFCEQGVILARYVFDPAPLLPREPHLDCVVPVRLLIDADSLPTNASRSAVREDSELFRQVMTAAHPALGQLIDALRARVLGEGEAPEAVSFRASATPSQLEDALGALVCVAVGARSRGSELSLPARALLHAPVLRDGCGKPRAYSELVAGKDTPLYLHEGDEPLDEELSPWMRDVLWIRGRVAERALSPLRTVAADSLVEHARAGLERKRQVMAHAPTRVAVPASPQHLLREAFAIREGAEAGLTGEVALRAVGPGGCTVRVFFEGRELAVSALGPAVVPLPCDLAIAWDGRLQVRFGFDGVEDDLVLRSAIARAVAVAVLVAGGLIAKLAPLDGSRVPEPSEGDQALRSLLCAAIGTSTTVAAGLGLPTRAIGPIRAGDPLWRAPVWPTTEPGRYLSLAEIEPSVRTRGGLPVAAPRARGRAADGRAVLALGPAERAWLAACVRAELVWVPYDQALLGPRQHGAWAERRDGLLQDELERAQQAEGEPGARFAVWFKRPGVRGLVAPAPEPRVVRMHAGQVLERAPAARTYGPALVVIDEATVLPTPGWDGIAWSGSVWSRPAVERELVRALLAALEGEAPSEAIGEPATDPGALASVHRRFLLLSAVALRDELAGDLADPGRGECELLLSRLASLPLVRMLDPEGVGRWASLEVIDAAHAGAATVPLLGEVPGFATLAWYPLVIEDAGVIAAVDAWLSGRLTPAAAELDSRRRQATAEGELRKLLAAPALDPYELGDLAPADAPRGKHAEEGLTVAVAFGARTAEGHVRIDLLRQRRAVGRLALQGLPLDLVARVGLDDRALFVDLRTLSDAGVAAVRRAVLPGAVALVRHLIEAEQPEGTPSPLTEPRLAATLRYLLAEHQALSLDVTALRAALLDRARWPTAQGGLASLRELRREGGEVLAARSRFLPWHEGDAPSDLDRPVLFLPPNDVGEGLLEVVRGLVLEVSDVSAALAALQQRRAAGGGPPRLPGAPSDPLLRTAIDEPGLAGEMELLAGERSLLTIHDLGGLPRDLGLELPFGLVAVARTDAIDGRGDGETAARVVELARRWVRGLLPRAALPELARHALRSLLLGPRREGDELTASERAAEVLPDIRGGWHSLASLERGLEKRKGKRVLVTTSPPPYPELGEDRRVLRLSEHEMKVLRGLLPVLNATTMLRLELEADERRRARPVEALVLEPAVRARCLSIRRIEAEGLCGELGLLEPAAASFRGVRVHLTRRPLCQLDDAPGWPIVAVVDDERMKPNRYFDGPRTSTLGLELLARLRALAGAMARELFQEPEEVAVAVAVDAGEAPRAKDEEQEPATGEQALAVLGLVWLPRRWPRAPAVRVRAPGLVGGEAEVALRRLGGAAGFDGTLPVAGDLLALPVTAGADLHHALAKVAFERGQEMLELARGQGTLEAAELARYRWSFALLGAKLEPAPRAPTAAGGEVGAEEVLAELSSSDGVWFSARAGASEGDFPDEPPPFVLLDDDGPLLDVLRARAPDKLRELGGMATVATAPSSRPKRAPAETRPPPQRARPRGPDEEEATADSWLGGLSRWIVQAFRELPPPAPITRSLRETIEQRIALLALPGEPLAEVAFARSGRAVRYQARHKRVVIHRDHPAVRRLLPAGKEPEPLALGLLLAAIVTEIDRAQEAVTPAEVLHVLTNLLAEG